jgi:hypothetical protein
MHTRAIFILEQKERGNRQTAGETEKKRVRVWERCRKKDLGICHKTDRWEKPTDQFLG